jgi:electron transfer flavoprotein beta subunit
MDIIVCLKAVPETAEVKFDQERGTMIREGVNLIINPFDEYAIEEGLRIKERLGGKVTVICMGPPQAESLLREAIALGVEEAILLTDRVFAGADTLATSYTLAKAIEKLGKYDLIICGKQAIDGDTAQVGPGIAVHLDIPQVVYVKKIEEIKEALPEDGGGYARVERMIEEGYEVIRTPLPALFTVVKEINEPRLPSLKGKLKAKKAEIKIWGAKDLEVESEKIGLDGSATEVIRIFTPKPRGEGEILSGEVSEVVDKLAKKLKEQQVI